MKSAYYHPAIALTFAATTGTGLVLLGQATALVVALTSLDFGRNVFPPEVIAGIMGVSFLILFLSSGLNLLTRGAKRQFIELAKVQEKGPAPPSLKSPPRSVDSATGKDGPE